MISKKVTPKVQKILLNPEGREVWQAATVARGIARTIAKEIGGADQIEITPTDALIVRRIAQILGTGNPAYNPFAGGRAFGNTIMLQAPVLILRALGVEN